MFVYSTEEKKKEERSAEKKKPRKSSKNYVTIYVKCKNGGINCTNTIRRRLSSSSKQFYEKKRKTLKLNRRRISNGRHVVDGRRRRRCFFFVPSLPFLLMNDYAIAVAYAHAVHCKLLISIHRYSIRILNAFETIYLYIFFFAFFGFFDFGHVCPGTLYAVTACIFRFVMDLGEVVLLNGCCQYKKKMY